MNISDIKISADGIEVPGSNTTFWFVSFEIYSLANLLGKGAVSCSTNAPMFTKPGLTNLIESKGYPSGEVHITFFAKITHEEYKAYNLK